MDAAIVRLLQDADVGTRQLGLSLNDFSSRVAWKTNLGLDYPGAVQQDMIMFCFACIKPTGRKQLQNWSDCGRSSHESSVQPELFEWPPLKHGFKSCIARKKAIDNGETKKSETSVVWRTPSVDTCTLGKDSIVRWVKVPAISNPSKCQSSKETWERICTCLHYSNCETWRRKHSGLGMHQCWRRWKANGLSVLSKHQLGLFSIANVLSIGSSNRSIPRVTLPELARLGWTSMESSFWIGLQNLRTRVQKKICGTSSRQQFLNVNKFMYKWAKNTLRCC